MSEETIFYHQLREQIKRTGKSFNQVERELGYPRNSLNNYKTNATEPSGNRLVELADYFNISPEYLISNKKNIKADSLKESFLSLDFEQKRELYSICQSWATSELLSKHPHNLEGKKK